MGGSLVIEENEIHEDLCKFIQPFIYNLPTNGGVGYVCSSEEGYAYRRMDAYQSGHISS